MYAIIIIIIFIFIHINYPIYYKFYLYNINLEYLIRIYPLKNDIDFLEEEKYSFWFLYHNRI